MTKPLIASFIVSVFLSWPPDGVAQSNTTKKLHEQCEQAMSLYFYKSTLRMLNQAENKEFDNIIKGIEKMKFLLIDKSAYNFGSQEYHNLTSEYRSEHYEEIMSSRFDGKNFDVYLNEKNGASGMVVLINDSSNLYVLDILGKVELSKISQLFKTLDSSAEIGKMINSITTDDIREERLKKGTHKN